MERLDEGRLTLAEEVQQWQRWVNLAMGVSVNHVMSVEKNLEDKIK